MSYQMTFDVVARPGDRVYFMLASEIQSSIVVAISHKLQKDHGPITSYVVVDNYGESVSLMPSQVFADRKSLMESLFPEFKGKIQ